MRLASTTAELAALLREHVTAHDQASHPSGAPDTASLERTERADGSPAVSPLRDAAPPSVRRDAPPARTASDASDDHEPALPGPTKASPGAWPASTALPPAEPRADDDPFAVLWAPATGAESRAVAEELLADRVLEKVQERLRDEALRRFGPGGGGA